MCVCIFDFHHFNYDFCINTFMVSIIGCTCACNFYFIFIIDVSVVILIISFLDVICVLYIDQSSIVEKDLVYEITLKGQRE